MPEIHQLISLETHSLEGETVQTVNARSLHVFLKSGKDFSSWIKNRIQQYEFMENKDYIVFTHSGENPSGGRPVKEYAISIEMAKEISMVERNEKGKEARQYFIQCEKRAKALPTDPIQILNDPSAMRGLLLTYTEKVLALESQLNEMAPDVQALQRIAKSEGGMCITNAAKELQVRPKNLFAFLREQGWIYRRIGGKHWIAYQNKIQSGYLEHKISIIPCDDGIDKIREQVLVTPKGLAKLSQKLTYQAA
ncbi:phage antirepressor KilAC domain-containing protein [Candidatus Hamiltonella endosymbiont of Tuberolachnus salignus]|uniref:phage antirepressor KilAC domain-containing protein n=1 Tax=Candidatus Williamhamiltonella endosymbiont of Tuberolachnus salignus TaxID=3077954 RepID=UPI0030CE5F12